ncbi:MAG: aldo/keto reductase [Bacteroidales bacterium]
MNSFSPTASISPDFSRTAIGLWRLHSWDLKNAHLLDFIEKCMDAGITTFDHADIYGNYSCEEIFGQAMAGQSSLRARMQLVSKCGIKLVSDKRPDHKVKTYDTSKVHIIQSVENSLKALQTDFLDVLLIHRPDPLMNADETAEAFRNLRESGKVLHFGVSNFMPHQFDLLQSRLDFPLVTNQVEISILKPDTLFNGIIEHCQQHRIQPMAWSPLAGGRLFHSDDPQAIRLRTVLTEIAAQHENADMEQIALAWLLKHPVGIVPVIGTGKINRVKNAVEAEQILLTSEQWFSILKEAAGADVP